MVHIIWLSQNNSKDGVDQDRRYFYQPTVAFIDKEN